MASVNEYPKTIFIVCWHCCDGKDTTFLEYTNGTLVWVLPTGWAWVEDTAGGKASWPLCPDCLREKENNG